MYVNGFDPKHHCQRCLVGTKSKRLNLAQYRVGDSVTMNEARAPFVYICGGARDWVYADNLHIALRNSPGSRGERRTYNGYVVQWEDADEVAIPDLPRHWNGYTPSFTTCRNFRFGVAHFPAAIRGQAGLFD